MEDHEVITRIGELVAREHQLAQRHVGQGLKAEEAAELRQLGKGQEAGEPHNLAEAVREPNASIHRFLVPLNWAGRGRRNCHVTLPTTPISSRRRLSRRGTDS